MFIFEAKQPNETAWDNLLTREAFEEMVKFEEFLYSLKLPENALGDALPPNQTEPRMIGLDDLCQQYNITTEEMDEDLEEDCKKDEPYGCPVKLKEKCFST